MEKSELRERVRALLSEGNYIGAFGHVATLIRSDPDRIDLTGQVANAIVRELETSRSASVDRQAWLRSQLAWVCRDVEGLSFLYREQLRGRPAAAQDDILLALKDLASGHPEDAMDRVRRSLDGAQNSIRSGEASDKVQGFLKEAEQGIRDGIKSVGGFFESIRQRGEAIRREENEESGEKPPSGSGDDWTPPGAKPPGDASG